MNHLDFLTFQLNVLSSLSPHAPLEQNLRAVMAPALAKICKHCGAEAVFHVFENVAMNEVHAMAVGRQACDSAPFRDELNRRSAGGGPLASRQELPRYRRFEHPAKSDLYNIEDSEKPEYRRRISKSELNMLKLIAADGISGPAPSAGDGIIVVSLGSKGFARLGTVIAWAPQQDDLEKKFNNLVLREGLVTFRLCMQRLLINLFSNYYDMGPETYLPSYQLPGAKEVTLLCAQIRGFERICQIIDRRYDFNSEQKSKCLLSLVNCFTDTAARIIERIGGRIDQLWGSGLIAVFGEYLHKPDTSAFPSCQEALLASAEIVEAFRTQADTWLQNDFRISEYKRHNYQQVDVQAAIGIDHGKVLFDYVGGERHRVFMAVGERVNFVQQLAAAVGPPCQEGDAGCDPPILLSQPAHELAIHVLRDRPMDPMGVVHNSKRINLPAMPEPVPVFPIWPANVDRLAR